MEKEIALHASLGYRIPDLLFLQSLSGRRLGIGTGPANNLVLCIS